MIQVDYMRQNLSSMRPDQARPMAQSMSRIAARAPGAPDDGAPAEEEMVFVSPPPAPFPRILPGL